MLVIRKTDYNTKISEIDNEIIAHHNHDKYITAQEFNKFTSENISARLALANFWQTKVMLLISQKRQILMIN